jgi:cyclopropane fatty-acyl-phospholipid synthase-like methyltransferase
MPDKPYYLAYENRYQKVYDAGGDGWGHKPDDEELIANLTEWVNKYNLRGKRVIEFACGEGASGVILSKLGCIYHGVDIAPSAVNKAKDRLKDYPAASVSLLDMVNQQVDGIYDAALDVMGFHMLVADPDRMKYLKNAFSCLKNNAPMFFFRELYEEDAHDEFIGSFDEWLSITKNDYDTPQQMFFRKDDKDVEIQIPFVPGRAKTNAGYTRELSETGFIVDSIIVLGLSYKTTYSASIYVHKP